MYIVMRLVSLLLVVVALMLLGADAVTSLERHGQIAVRSVQTVWGMFDASGLAAFKAWVASLPSFVSGGINSVLAIPGWAITGVIGVILAFVFGRKHEAA